MRNVPNNLETDEHRQNKHDEVLHKACWRNKAQTKGQQTTNGQQCDLLFCGRLERCDFLLALFLRCQLFWLFLWLGCNRLNFWWGWWECNITVVCNGCTTDHVVFHVVVYGTIFFRRQICHHVTDVSRV